MYPLTSLHYDVLDITCKKWILPGFSWHIRPLQDSVYVSVLPVMLYNPALWIEERPKNYLRADERVTYERKGAVLSLILR